MNRSFNKANGMIEEDPDNRKRIFLVLIAASIILISYLHYSTNPGIRDLHNVFAELYYIPLLMSAFTFGLRGAVIVYISISLIYFPHVIMNWTNATPFVANQLLHGLFSGTFAFLAGYLVDREKRNREQAEKDRYLAGLGQASAAIVHDLKNPLISISGFARRLNQGKGDVDTASEAIIKSAEDMEKIVHDVLDFSKPHNMDFRETGITDVINEVLEYCKMKADEKEVVLSVYLPDEISTISIDRSHLLRALINLVNNAIEASDKTGVVDVMAEFEKDSLVIRIKDHGAGMDKETLENIFIPFYTKKSSGTGLGMAIAKKIIEGHKGKIIINSKQGSGTEVIINMPRDEREIQINMRRNRDTV
ncbi:MAG TPA: HAMP domain-containing histidine kinase [Nitrospirae bacterium]|nr:sensor protein ZraS [bacterium BMS3Bbin09]HDO67189.1 HAMP domain-containing histidine kinase [Nitrospirota bacterium]HEW81363.1 HAMP domain-containing histidine kinase [Nitrospirota bacterium]